MSDFLLKVLLEALAGVDYDTAERALAENGWRQEEYFDVDKDDWVASKAVLKQQCISFAKLKKYGTDHDGVRVFGCYDEVKNVLYVGTIEDGEISLVAVNRDEAERIFIDIDELD